MGDIARLKPDVDIVLTSNVPESLSDEDVQVPNVTHIKNRHVRGFGGNHNAALLSSKTKYVCVGNPDLRLLYDPFPELMKCMADDDDVGVVAPLIVNSAGELEDNIRKFPTPLSVVKKFLKKDDSSYKITNNDAFEVDWAAGMFLFFRTDAFRAVGGFDDDYFMYYEDVDICARLWQAGWKVAVCPSVKVVHDAQRTSHQKFRYLYWHLSSMIRFFSKHIWNYPIRKM